MSEASWESEDMVDGASELVSEYEQSHAEPPKRRPGRPRKTVCVPEAKEDPLVMIDPELIPRLADESKQQVHMAMSAMLDMRSDESIANESDPDHIVCAVTAGVGLLDGQTPSTYREASTGTDAAMWGASMDAEISSCMALGAWEYVDRSSLPKGTNVLPVKWVYRIKTDEHGDVLKKGGFKSRVTPKGFKQKHGEDYFEVYAATGMYKTKRVGLSLAAKRQLITF